MFDLDGADQTADGWPVAGALIGIPPGARVQARVLVDQIESISGQHRLSVLQPRLLSGEDLSEPGLLAHRSLDLQSPTSPWTPPELVHISEPATLRQQQVVRVQVFPVQVMPVDGRLRLHRHAQIELTFLVGAGALIGTGVELLSQQELSQQELDPFEGIYQQILLNYQQARAWRLAPTPSPLSRATGDPLKGAGGPGAGALPSPAYKIVVDHDDLYRLTFNDLVAVGLPVSTINPQTFRLIHQGQVPRGAREQRAPHTPCGVCDAGQEVALRVVGEADGRFDADDFMEFYGEQRRGEEMFSKYSDENVYWLTYGGAIGARMSESPASPIDDSLPSATTFSQTLRFEPSNLWFSWAFVSLATRQTDDTWYWDRLMASNNSVTGTYAMTLPALATGNSSEAVTLRGELAGGRTNRIGTHHVLIHLNREVTPTADLTWSNRTLTDFQVSLPADRLAANNALRVALQTDTLNPDDIYLNWLEVTYPRAFMAMNDRLTFTSPSRAANITLTQFSTNTLSLYDISLPTQTQRLSVTAQFDGSAYALSFQSPPTARALLATSDAQTRKPKSITAYQEPDLRSVTLGADYIIITHKSLLGEAQRLADYRAAQGLRVRVVDVDDLYNQFNAGLFHPVAIRNFLAYAFQNWQPPAPAWVVLVGGGNWNFKGFNPAKYGPLQPNLIPPYLWWVDPWQGEVDATNRFVTVAGDDLLPDLFIGRLPADTPQQLKVMIDKLIRYETQASQQDWQGRTLFAADNIPDAAGDFWALSDAVADRLPAPMTAVKAYLPASDPASILTTTRAITQSFNDGVLLSNYVGHAAADRWAHESIFTAALAASLNNSATLPVNLSMTCLDGYFYYPNDISLVQVLLWNPNGGVVASWSPTGLGVSTGHDVLHRGFYRAVFDNDLTRLGPATTLAKLDLFATSQNLDLIDTFTVFGDPYTSLAVWRPALEMTAKAGPESVLSAGDQLTFTLTISNTGRRVANALTLSVTLPAELSNLSLVNSSQAMTATTASAWNLAPLNAAGSVSATFKATARSILSAGRPVIVTARLAPAVGEAAPAEHLARVSVTVRSAYSQYIPLVLQP